MYVASMIARMGNAGNAEAEKLSERQNGGMNMGLFGKLFGEWQ